jgi:hypothetical protein
MVDTARSSGLRTIFSFFLGLMLTAFVGVGVYTFHGPPDQFKSQLRDLDQREQSLMSSRSPDEPTAADREQIEEINRQRRELNEAEAEARKPWGRSTSVILIVFATLAMVASLVRANQMPVIANGLLLGGVFTMLYGVGWIIFTDTSVARFVVLAVALAITLGLGYVRFVRRGTLSPAGAGAATPATDVIADLDRRVRDLETRLNEAANALGPRRDG